MNYSCTVAALHVITSYSIHYTKLYDEQVDHDSQGAPQWLGRLFEHMAGQAVAGQRRLTDGRYGQGLVPQPAGMPLCQQLAGTADDGGIGHYGLQTADIAAVTAFAKRRDLNVADFPHVAVLAQEDAAVAEDAGAGAMVHAHQDGA